jgi:hypothetical protein
MKRTYKVISISEATENNNQLIKFKGENEVDTPFGEKTVTETYYIAVKAGKVAVAVDAEVELDITSDYRVVERPYLVDGELPIGDDGKPICDDDGNPLMLKWIYPR